MKKLAFTTAALDGPDPFEQKIEIPDAVRQAVSWCAERTDSQIIWEREVLIASIEQEGNALWYHVCFQMCLLLSCIAFACVGRVGRVGPGSAMPAQRQRGCHGQ